MDINRLSQKLIDLDKKAQELDEVLKNVRVEINNIFWDLVELKSNRDKKKGK